MTHCDYVLIFSLCVLLAYDLCPQHFLSVGKLLTNCTSLQQCSVNNKSTSPNMQCTHTHILLFGSKFDIILAMYVQMLDIYIYIYISKISDIFRKCHIFQPWHEKRWNKSWDSIRFCGSNMYWETKLHSVTRNSPKSHIRALWFGRKTWLNLT